MSAVVTPIFFTATLPPTPTRQQATQIPIQASPVPDTVEESNMPPIEGVTTTQVNVRAAPSTASASLGLIGIFVKVQVIGRDASGSWYQIVYAEAQQGKGWVRAEYVQVNAGAEIRPVDIEPASGAVISGMVTQKVNVRNSPSVESELLGLLNPNDLVSVTGRDAESKWIQIEFAGAPDGKGWVAAEFLQVTDIESVPKIGGTLEETPTPAVGIPAVAVPAKTAMQDGDSMQSPLATVVFSVTGSRALQVSGDVSAPDGDTEDWVQFTSQVGVVSIQVTCQTTTLHTELWNNKKGLDDFPCGKVFLENVTPGDVFFLHLTQNGVGYSEYTLDLEVIQ